MTATIRTEQLTKRYGRTTALDALDLEIEPGEVFGYLGPNGAGKSTTIALLLGLIRPTSGSARIFDLDVRDDAPAIHRRLAYVPSEANLWPSLTGAETLQFLARVHGSTDGAYREQLVERFQLAPDKKVRAGLAMAVFGVAFVLRMVADTGPGAHWLLWTTPFGWTQLMAPFTENDAWPLVPAVLTVAVLGAVATRLAARRDVGAGVLASRDTAPPRSFGLRSPLGLATRLELPVLAAWCAGAAAGAFAFGIIAKLTTASIPDSMADTPADFGVQGSFARQYFGVAFLLSATLVALLPASQMGAAADEEMSGRLTAVLAGPPSRAAWFAGRLALTAAAVVVAAGLTGLFAWLGSVSQGVDLGLATMVGAGLNLVPTAMVVLGVGAVVLALAPPAAAPTVYAVVVASVVIDLLGTLVTDVSWLERLSLFHSMALAPAQPVDATVVVVTLVVGVVLAAGATLAFSRRDQWHA